MILKVFLREVIFKAIVVYRSVTGCIVCCAIVIVVVAACGGCSAGGVGDSIIWCGRHVYLIDRCKNALPSTLTCSHLNLSDLLTYAVISLSAEKKKMN